jgi:hypothetical protein
LLRTPAVLAAVVCTSLLAALAASSAPLGRAGLESEALKSKIQALTPLGAGLTIERGGTFARGGQQELARADRARHAAALRLGRTLPSTGAPVLTTSTVARVGGTSLLGSFPLFVVPMARDGATAHVQPIAGPRPGAWVSSAIARLPGLHPGGTLILIRPGYESGDKRSLSIPVGAVYRQLDADLGNPYWVNFAARIRPRNPDAGVLPTFVLVDPATVYRAAHAVGDGALSNVYEFPVDTRAMTPAAAKRVARAFDGVRRSLSRSTALSRELGCSPTLGGRCQVTSSLTAAVALAKESAASLTPIVFLLTALAVLLAIAAAFVAGLFGARQRAVEARLSLTAGESWAAFASRSALEAALPAFFGGALGVLLAIELVSVFAPSGTVDRAVVVRAVTLGAAAALVAVGALACGTAIARGRLGDRPRAGRNWRRLWWELPVLAAAAAGYAVVERGGGLARSGAAHEAHPRLVVFLLPLLVAAGASGLASRAARVWLRRRRAAPRSTVVFLASRRLAAARALPLTLTVTAAVSISALAFAEILGTSLHANRTEKAYVANGADVQGLIDVGQTLPRQFPYPITKVIETFNTGRLDDASRQVEVLAVDPASLRRVLRWHWSGDPQAALRTLGDSRAPLPAIAIGAARGSHQLLIGGGQLPLQVVATLPAFPGMPARGPMLVVSADRLTQAARTASLGDPFSGASAYVWARGGATAVERALARSTLAPFYLTSVADFLNRDDLTTGERAYTFLRVIALGAAGLALVALLLYLHSRSRSQLLTSVLLSRMGIAGGPQAVAVALEAALLIAFASAVGIASALLTAAQLVSRVDPLPAYAPAVTVQVPWALVAVSFVLVTVFAAAVGALAAVAARRGDVEEALRLA